MSKIISYQVAEIICADLHQHKKTIIFKSGVFDVLHVAHILMLTQAKAIADVLIVGVGADTTLQQENRFAYFDENNRAMAVAALECVDYVVVEREENYKNIDHSSLLKIIKPDFFSVPTDDKLLEVKKMLANAIGSKVIFQQPVKVMNYGELIEPHSSILRQAK